MLRFSDNLLDDKYDESKYVSSGYGRKTVDTFGIRRFEIFRLARYNDTGQFIKNKRLVLYDTQSSNAIEEDVYNYIERKPYVFAIGNEGYTKLNYESAEVLQSKDLSEFSLDDQLILKEIKK